DGRSYTIESPRHIPIARGHADPLWQHERADEAVCGHHGWPLAQRRSRTRLLSGSGAGRHRDLAVGKDARKVICSETAFAHARRKRAPKAATSASVSPTTWKVRGWGRSRAWPLQSSRMVSCRASHARTRHAHDALPDRG